MKRYISSILAGFLLICLILSGCSLGNKNQKENSKSTVKVAIMYSEKSQGSVYKEIVKEFEKKNENVKIEIVNEFNDESKIRESVFQKGDIDIVGIKRNQVIEFAKSGLLTDITDLVEEKELNKKLFKISLAYGKYNGKNYGIGDMPMTIEWFYNVSMFNKFGLKEPQNLKDLIDISTKLKAKKITPISIGAMDGWTLAVLFGAITAQTTGIEELTSNYGADEKSYEKIPGIINAFSNYSKLTSSAIPKDSMDINYKKSLEDFVTGRSAILPTGSWAIESIEQMKPAGFTYQVLENPIDFVEQPVTKYSASSGQVLVIPSKSKNIDTAKKFIEFLFSEDAQKMFADKGYISSLKAVNSSEDAVKRRILMHLDAADDNSIMIIDNMEPKMAEATTYVLQDILEERVRASDAWNRILKTTFK